MKKTILALAILTMTTTAAAGGVGIGVTGIGTGTAVSNSSSTAVANSKSNAAAISANKNTNKVYTYLDYQAQLKNKIGVDYNGKQSQNTSLSSTTGSQDTKIHNRTGSAVSSSNSNGGSSDNSVTISGDNIVYPDYPVSSAPPVSGTGASLQGKDFGAAFGNNSDTFARYIYLSQQAASLGRRDLAVEYLKRAEAYVESTELTGNIAEQATNVSKPLLFGGLVKYVFALF